MDTEFLRKVGGEVFRLAFWGICGALAVVAIVMIQRAPLGSLERFVGVLIEHFAGAFPLWLSPEQVRVLTVSEKSEAYGREIEQKLRAAGLRVSGDYRAEKLGSKIREAQLGKIPYMLVVGEKEQTAGTVAVRHRVGDPGGIDQEGKDRSRSHHRRKGVEVRAST